MTASGVDRPLPRSTRRTVPVGRWARRLIRGRADAARWERPALLGLLLATGVLYLVDLGVNGYANAFYAAAVQAGSQSWEAFFYGSSDAGNSITVDKPPAFLWVMGISVRLFGLNSWSLLVPEALMGVASVALLYAIVRRRFSAAAALGAGAALATTPVAALMFRYDNPDALLTLLTVLSIWLVLRGVETGRLRYVVWAGIAVGFAFLTKQLQGFLVLPVLVGVYLYCSALPLRRRIVHLLWAALAVVLSAGWWVAIVELVPASARPYIGGSQTNSFLELTFGYNGLGRVTGDEAGSVVPGGTGGAGSWGSTGLLRLFGSEFAGQITWLLPTALLLLVASLVAIGFRRRTSVRLATVLLLGGSLLVTGVVFSLMGGIFHPYYTIALAPFIAGLVGVGAGVLWERRRSWWARGAAAAAVVVTVAWQWHLLSETGSWQPWIRWVVLVAGAVTAVGVLVPWGRAGATGAGARGGAGARAGDLGRSGAGAGSVARAAGAVGADARAAGAGASARAGDLVRSGAAEGGGFRPLGWEAVPTPATHPASGRRREVIPARWNRPLAVVVVVGAAVTGLLGPMASSIETVTTAHTGALPSAGPSATTTGFGGGRAGAPTGGGPGAGAGGGTGGGAQGGMPGGGPAGGSSTGQSGQGGQGAQGAGIPSTPGSASDGSAGGGPSGNGGAGNLLGGSTEVDSALRSALLVDADDYTWVAATVGSNSAASYQLATGHAVMPIGGFNGTDPSPTLAEFQQDVADGAVHYFIASGTGSSQDSDDSASAITNWVEEHFTATSIGGVTVYDLTEAS